MKVSLVAQKQSVEAEASSARAQSTENVVQLQIQH